MKIEELENLIEDEEFVDEQRSYLGISQMGTPCKRQLWYDFRFATPKKPISAREKRLFNRGHFEELIILNDLVKHGIVADIEIGECVHEVFKNVFHHNLPEYEQEGVTFAHGHGSGHGDGKYRITTDTQKLLLEFKTMNTKAFTDLKRDKNLQRSKVQHFVQVQAYMRKYKLEKCLYIAVHKNNDERLYIYIDLDKKFADKELDKATQIIFMTSPPERISEDRNFYMCQPYLCKITNKLKDFCPHFQVCKNDARPQRTCRTCKHIEMHDQGRWLCTKKDKFRTLQQQIKGCKKYEVIK